MRALIADGVLVDGGRQYALRRTRASPPRGGLAGEPYDGIEASEPGKAPGIRFGSTGVAGGDPAAWAAAK